MGMTIPNPFTRWADAAVASQSYGFVVEPVWLKFASLLLRITFTNVSCFSLLTSRLICSLGPPTFDLVWYRDTLEQVSPRFTRTGAVAALHRLRAVTFMRHRHRQETEMLPVELDLPFDCDEVRQCIYGGLEVSFIGADKVPLRLQSEQRGVETS